jgi:hypothetical protein
LCRVLIANPALFGGENSFVEVDEAVLVKRKYNQGRGVRETWCFAIYDINTRCGVVYIVNDRTRETLFPLIVRHVRQGTTIYSDSARVYSALTDLGYNHYTVNHSIGEFMNYSTGCTTNRVEAFWQQIKHPNKMRKKK